MENISKIKRLWLFAFKSTLLGSFLGCLITLFAFLTLVGGLRNLVEIIFFIFICCLFGLIPAFIASFIVGWLAIYSKMSHYTFTIIFCFIMFFSYVMIYEINSSVIITQQNYPDEFQYKFVFVFALIFIPSLACRYEFRRYLKNNETT